MQKINWDRFLFAVQGPLGNLNDSQTEGLKYIVESMENDIAINDLRWAAYMLATAWHETGKTFKPVEEIGKGAGHEYGIPDTETGKAYYGIGFVQITFKRNYRELSNLLHIDLVHNPKLALDPSTAYSIMSIGMRRGLFTGLGLPVFFNDQSDNAIGARKIVNGLDCAEKIAGYHNIFLKALKDSKEVS